MSKRIKVLVVEDSSLTLDLLQHVFRKTETELLSATTFQEGVEKTSSEKPDVILLDVHLPDGNALDQIERLREAQGDPPAPIIAISGMPPEELRKKARKAGCADFLSKPFSVMDLASRVADCLGEEEKVGPDPA